MAILSMILVTLAVVAFSIVIARLGLSLTLSVASQASQVRFNQPPR